jgi:hypothetical protein
MAKHSLIWTCLCAIAISVVGCDKKAASNVPQNTNSFASADARIKNDWETIQASAATNNYVVAILTCRKMQALAELTPDQRDAVNSVMTDVNDRMTTAAQKGDPAALRAIEDLRKQWR